MSNSARAHSSSKTERGSSTLTECISMPRPIARFVARRTPQVAASEDWIRKARRNLRVAKANLDAGFADVAGFYAQQAAEFALKALQIHRTGRFARIHDLTRLSRDLAAPPRILKLAAHVTPAYVAARYPDAGGKITRRLAESMIEAARRIVRWVRRQMV